MSNRLKAKRRSQKKEPEGRILPFLGYTQIGPIYGDSNPDQEIIFSTRKEIEQLHACLDKPLRSEKDRQYISDFVFDKKRAFFSVVPDIPGYDFLRVEKGMYLDPLTNTINVCTSEESIDALVREEALITGVHNKHLIITMNFPSAFQAARKHGACISIDEAYRSSLRPLEGSDHLRAYLYMDPKDSDLQIACRTPKSVSIRKDPKTYECIRKRMEET